MRISAFCLAALVAVALVACAKSSTDNTSTSATTAPEATATEAATAAGTSGSMSSADQVPVYPGAKVEAAGAAGGASGKVLSTTDAFDKVYDWYKGKLTGWQTTKTSMGGQNMGSFTKGAGTSNVMAVTITVAAGKTMISIGGKQ